jgi:TonB family protein
LVTDAAEKSLRTEQQMQDAPRLKIPGNVRLNRHLFLKLLAVAVLLANPCRTMASIWASAPKPNFPEAALRQGSEGYVIVRAHVAKDGVVTRATISRSSGTATLDEAARSAVLKWKMNPAAIKPEYLAHGYDQRIDFRQEAPVAARYRDRVGYFGGFKSAKIWTYAPFPEYPAHERLMKSQGVTCVKVVIGPDGQVSSAVVVKSSGFPNLDQAARDAVRKWRARREYAGKCAVMPVAFTLRPVR